MPPFRNLAALCAVALAAIAAGQERPPLERYAPNDTAIMVSFRDLPTVWQRMQSLSFMKAVKDPSFKPFIDALKKEVTASVEATGTAGGIEFDKLAEIVRGQVLVTIRAPTNAGPKAKLELLVLADVAGKEDLVRGILDRAVNKAVQENKASKRVVGEVTILTPNKTGDAEKDRFCFTIKGGILVGADKPEVCARTAQALPGGPSNSLIQNERLKTFRRAFAKHAKGLGDVEIFVLNARALADAARADLDAPPPTAGSQSVEAVGVSLCAARGEFETLAQFMVVPRAETRLGSDVALPGRTLPTDPWAPDNAAAYLTFNVDVDKIYEQMVKQLELLGGVEQLEDRLREFPDKANPLITSIKKDVIDPLGDRLSFVVDRGEASQLRLLLAWKLRDSGRISHLITGIITQLGPLVTEKQVKGFNVYVFPPLPPPTGGGRRGQATQPPIWLGNAAVSVTKTHLVAATHVEMVDRMLNFQGQPGLAELTPASRILSKAPEAPSAVFYLKADEFGRLLYTAIASEAVQKQANAAASSLPKVKDAVPNFSTAIKEDKLPPFDEVKKYFLAPAGGYLTIEEGAIRAAIFSLK